MINNIYDLADFKGFLTNNVDIIFSSNKIDYRSLFLKTELEKYDKLWITLETDQKFDLLNITILDLKTKAYTETNDLVLVNHLREILKKLEVYKKTICIDITSINNVISFLLIRILLTEFQPKLLFVVYTEPLKYVKDDFDYQLSDDILGVRALPGFIKRATSSKKILVPLLGFERQRLPSLVDEIDSDIEVIPIIGFPTSTPGWKLAAQRANSRALEKLNCENKIRYVDVMNPFKLYNLFKKIAQQHEDSHMLIAPLGIRTHGLSAAIYVARNTHCSLIYDFPIEKNFRSEGILKSNVFNLSNFII